MTEIENGKVKINLWTDATTVEKLKALQFIKGGVTLTQAVNEVLDEFFTFYEQTERYQLYMKLKQAIQEEK